MQTAMTIEELLTEVKRQESAKRDYVANTQDCVRVIPDDSAGIKLELLKDGAPMIERLNITDHAHRQISTRLQIPWKYYSRLLHDHPDMVAENVNALFEREPSTRLFRTLDGQVRAFLSDRYLRLDNEQVLVNTLPAIVKGDVATTVLSTNVTSDRMDLKILFTDDQLKHTITHVNGKPRNIQPGFRLSNSEVGKGSLSYEAFFFDNYCTNGCVFGKDDLVSFSRSHLGGKLNATDGLEIESDKTRELADQYIMSAINDVIRSLSSTEHVEQMVQRLRVAANSEPVGNPVRAVDMAVQRLSLNESEHQSMLETFLRDRDYTQFGLSSAITEIGNKPEIATVERASELESIGGRIIDLNKTQWQEYVKAA